MSLILCRTTTSVYQSLRSYNDMCREQPRPWYAEEKISKRILEKYGFQYELPIIVGKLRTPHTISRWMRRHTELSITETAFGGINRRIEIWE